MATHKTFARTATSRAAAENVKAEIHAAKLEETVGWKTKLAASVMAFITAFTGGYQTAMWTSMIFAAVTALSGYAFIGFIIATLFAVGSIYATLEATSRVGEYIGSGQLSKDMHRSGRWVRGLFTRGDKVVAGATS